MGDKPVFTSSYIFFVKNNWLYRVYGTEPALIEENRYNYHYKMNTKESSCDHYIKLIKEKLECPKDS